MSPDLETRVRRANPMARHEQLDQLFGEGMANQLLRDIHHRRVGHMPETTEEQTKLTSAPEPGPEPETRTLPRRTWLVAASAAAVTVLLIGALAVITSTRDADTAAQGSDPVGVVLSAYEALNAGDLDAWLGHFADDAVIFEFTKQTAPNLYGVLGAANYRTQFEEACLLIEQTPQGATQVECTITETNDFHAAGGISLTRTETFVVNEDGRISSARAAVLAFTQPGYYVFNEAFWDWLRDVHPEVFGEIQPELTTHLPGEPEHMRVMLDYVDEFLAQSERYPIGDGS